HARGVGAVPLVGRRRDRHDQPAGGEARARGGDLLRDHGAGDRLRLLASVGRGRERRSDPRLSPRERGDGAAHHPHHHSARRCAQARLRLRERAAVRDRHRSRPHPGGGEARSRSDHREIHSMTITVVGTVAFDAIQTPFGKVDRCLGGSATYFSVAASFFSRVNLAAVVGDAFTDEDASIFAGRNINLDGLQRVAGAKSFFWRGEYGFDLNVAKTLDTQLNVFAGFKPRLNDEQRRANILFLANAEPKLQMEALDQAAPKIVAMDTMNLWIATAREELTHVFRRVDLVIINDAEVRQYTNESNVIKGARQILSLGVKTLVIKRGEYGVLMMTRDRVFAAPAYPLEQVFDPTRA